MSIFNSSNNYVHVDIETTSNFFVNYIQVEDIDIFVTIFFDKHLTQKIWVFEKDNNSRLKKIAKFKNIQINKFEDIVVSSINEIIV